MTERSCICPEGADAIDCIDVRHHGYAPGPNRAMRRRSGWWDECECGCHGDDLEDENGDTTEPSNG